MAKTPRTWSGARTPSGLKRVRQADRRHEVLGPRRTAAKTYVAKALSTVGASTDPETATAALTAALSALDRAAKAGAIHPNAAARRKSRLTIKINAALGGATVGASGQGAEADRQGRGSEGRQGAHRRRQVDQGQGRPDRRRQGPRRAEQDGPCRGGGREGRRVRRRPRPRSREGIASGDEGCSGEEACREVDRVEAGSQGDRQEGNDKELTTDSLHLTPRASSGAFLMLAGSLEAPPAGLERTALIVGQCHQERRLVEGLVQLEPAAGSGDERR